MVEYIQTNSYRRKNSDEKNFSEILLFKRILSVMPLNREPIKKTVYNKKMNAYLEIPVSFFSYEIEVKNVEVKLAREFRKSADLYRRLLYKYDWICVEKSSNGQFLSVTNSDEIRANWDKLRERILVDYHGDLVESYLEKISTDMADAGHFDMILNQYDEFGLLFPLVPQYAEEGSCRERHVRLDHRPDTDLLETTILMETVGNVNRYNLTWGPRNEKTDIRLGITSGSLEQNIQENMPERVEACIEFMYDDSIVNEWRFSLERVDNQ